MHYFQTDRRETFLQVWNDMRDSMMAVFYFWLKYPCNESR